MLTITDINGNTEGLTGYKSLKRYRNVSGEKSLAFFVMPTQQNDHSFEIVAEESIVEFDGEPYRIKQIAEKPKGQTYVKEVVALHTFFDLIDDHKYELHNGPLTFTAALDFVLGGTGYTWSIVDSFLAQNWQNFGDNNRLSLLQDVVKRYGAEFSLVGTHLTFRKRIGNATDFQFRYNYNVKTLARDVNTNNLSTYIKGYGKQNEDGTYVVESEYTSPNASTFGIRHAKPVRDERYTTLDGLNERLVAELQDTPEISITVDFADMRRAGYPYDVPSEGDDVFLIYEPMGIDVEARAMEITELFTEGSDLPIKTEVTIANLRSSVIDRWADTEKQVRDMIGSDGKVKIDILDAAVQRATEALKSAQTELEFNNGIIARAKDNPNHLVLITSAGIGVSTDGGNTFTEAITHMGVNTSVLTAGQIDANLITVMGGTLDAYSLIDANGLYVKGGAVSIERPDGFVQVDNGIPQNDFAIVGAEPPFTSGAVAVQGIWWATSSATPSDCQFYTFKHDARYLKVVVGMYCANAAAGSRISVVDITGNTLVQRVTYDTSNASDLAKFGETLTVDLGTPTGEMRSIYVRLNTGTGGNNAYGRVISMRKEG
ncbi:phage tail protein [Bacillus sp. ISL-37]|uniref:phage tail protein n=1 Tax=Bacillus sp. ISL-37 TaxID=2819123 RepID=UPI001BEC000C|nr:phage tail protein [Bacillus sp. ISL-37]